MKRHYIYFSGVLRGSFFCAKQYDNANKNPCQSRGKSRGLLSYSYLKALIGLRSEAL